MRGTALLGRANPSFIARRSGQRSEAVPTSLLVSFVGITNFRVDSRFDPCYPTPIPALLQGVSGDIPEAERGAAPAGRACNPARRRQGTVVTRAEMSVKHSAAHVEQSRGRAPAGARPASLGARRPGVIACPGTPRVRPLSAPAPTGALPPRFRGDEKGSAPGALRSRERSAGPAKRWLCCDD